jgi:HK97 family phage prohead protease
METRAIKLTKPEGKTLQGIASPFDSPALIRDARGKEFREIVRPGAFTDAITHGDIRALVDHDDGRLLARQKSGTLRLQEQREGLWFSLDLPDTREGDDVKELVRRGDLDGMSISWGEVEDTWDKDTRELRKIALVEISVVTFPAYAKTHVELRSGLWAYRLKLLRATIN